MTKESVASSIQTTPTVDSLSVYPVPNNGTFNVLINSSEKTIFIKIYNSIGKIIYETKEEVVNGKVEKKIDLQPIQKGIYVVVCGNRTKRISVD